MNNDTKSKDGLALIVGGLFVLAIVFAAYKYFNSDISNEDDSDELGSISKEMNGEEDLNGNGASDERLNDEISTETQELGTGGPLVTESIEWVATDYNQGQIKPGNYEVKYGDTLWEIAEAAYGNGGDWVKILNANSGSVGYLPNGQQALIFSGQNLMIP